MNYKSTRNPAISITSAQAIAQGLSAEGGLFVPENLPQINEDFIKSLCDKSYADRAYDIFKLFLTDFTDEEIRHCVKNAYADNFDTDYVTVTPEKYPQVLDIEYYKADFNAMSL